MSVPREPAAAACPSLPAAPPTSEASLPLDALTLILSFIPLRGRVLVASAVCKRWRKAALRSVTSLTVHPECAFESNRLDAIAQIDFSFAITQLSSLSSLRLASSSYICFSWMTLRQCTTLNRLRLCSAQSLHQDAPPGITALTLDPLSDVDTLALLRKYGSMLTTLKLRHPICLIPSPSLAAIALPRVTALSLRFDAFLPLAVQCASRLTSLSMYEADGCDQLAFKRITFPALRHLRLEQVPLEEMEALLNCMPALTSLHLIPRPESHHVYTERVRTLLTRLGSKGSPVQLSDAMEAYLATCPRLQRVDGAKRSLSEQHLGPYATHLTLRSLARLPRFLAALPSLAHVVSLQVSLSIDEAFNKFTVAPMPSLRSLVIEQIPQDALHLAACFALSLLRSAPSLRRLVLSCRSTSRRLSLHGTVQAARFFLALNRHGLAFCGLNEVPDMCAVALLLRQRKLLPWMAVGFRPSAPLSHELDSLLRGFALSAAQLVADASAGECDFTTPWTW